MTLTNEKAIEFATLRAKEVSETKDWRLRDKRSRAFKALAVKMLEDGKPYIVSTPHELAEKYPDLFSYDGAQTEQKFIWAIMPNYKGSYVKFSFGAI